MSRSGGTANSSWITFQTPLFHHYVEYGLAQGRGRFSASALTGRVNDSMVSGSAFGMTFTVTDDAETRLYRLVATALDSYRLSVSWARARISGKLRVDEESFYVASLESDLSNFSELAPAVRIPSLPRLIFTMKQFDTDEEFGNFLAFETGRQIGVVVQRGLAQAEAEVIYPQLKSQERGVSFGTYQGWSGERFITSEDGHHYYELSFLDDNQATDFRSAWDDENKDSLITMAFDCLPLTALPELAGTQVHALSTHNGGEVPVEEKCDTGVVMVISGTSLLEDTHEGFLGPVVKLGKNASDPLSEIFRCLKLRHKSHCQCP